MNIRSSSVESHLSCILVLKLCFKQIMLFNIQQYLNVYEADGIFSYKFSAAQKGMQGHFWCPDAIPLMVYNVTVVGKCLLNHLIQWLLLDRLVSSTSYIFLFIFIDL